MGENSKEAANLDQILEHYVGGAGRYQVLNTLIMAFVYYAGWYPIKIKTLFRLLKLEFLGLYSVFITNFVAYAPPHRCKVPICETGETVTNQTIFDPEWLQFAIPFKESSTNYLGGVQKYDGCLVYNQSLDLDPKVTSEVNYCQTDTFLNTTTKCEEFVYDKTYFDETLSTALNLVCDNQSYRSLLGTILIIGLLFGSLIGGRIGDQFGRKKACFGAIAAIVPTTIIAGHVESYYAYAILHFITMGCLPVIWVNCYVYSTEIFTPQWRYIFIGLYEIPFGYYIFNLIGYLNRTWTGIHIWVGIVTALILPVYFILPESVRWLAQNNKEKEAMEILKKVAKINARPLSTEDEEKVRVLVHAIAEESHQTEDKLTPIGNFAMKNKRTLAAFKLN